jgi:multidrug transporter EmrE-like cation transporter
MDRRWRVVVGRIILAWAPALAMLQSVFFASSPVSPRLAVSTPFAIFVGIATAVGTYAFEHCLLSDVLDSNRLLAAIVLFGAVLCLFWLGFSFAPKLTAVLLTTGLIGNAVGETLYRTVFGIIRPLPDSRR